MSVHRPPARTPRRVVLVLAAAIGLLTTVFQGASLATPEYLPEPTSIVVRALTDPATIEGSLGGAPSGAVPAVLAARGDTFVVEVSLRAGDDGSLEAASSGDQGVTLTASGPGTLTVPVAATIPAGTTTGQFVVSYDTAATDVHVDVSVEGQSGPLTGTSNAFDILRFLNFVPGTSSSLKDGTAGADGSGCAVVDKSNPVCGVVKLPRGASGDVALSLGDCPDAARCRSGAAVTQMIADLTAGGVRIYDRTHPAQMDLYCDKSMCGKSGVPHTTVLWSQSATGVLAPLPACARKGVIDPELTACTDYRASHRRGAGDLHLVILFLDDVRGSI